MKREKPIAELQVFTGLAECSVWKGLPGLGQPVKVQLDSGRSP